MLFTLHSHEGVHAETNAIAIPEADVLENFELVENQPVEPTRACGGDQGCLVLLCAEQEAAAEARA